MFLYWEVYIVIFKNLRLEHEQEEKQFIILMTYATICFFFTHLINECPFKPCSI